VISADRLDRFTDDLDAVSDCRRAQHRRLMRRNENKILVGALITGTNSRTTPKARPFSEWRQSTQRARTNTSPEAVSGESQADALTWSALRYHPDVELFSAWIILDLVEAALQIHLGGLGERPAVVDVHALAAAGV
jgi:hypothetical protein